MKIQFKIISIFSVVVLFNCTSQKSTKAHSHDGLENHSHEHENTSVSENDYFGDYTLEDKFYGSNTQVSIKGNIRTMVTNALPNHKTGEFPNQGNPNTISAQNKTYTFPVNPKYIGEAQWIREPGVALNGVKFEPRTAEVVICDTGENYRVEAFQNVIDLGLDFNHAHVQPTGAYHYHGAPTSVIETLDAGVDLVHVGFAHDGFPIYYSKSGKYKSSYKLLDGTREGEDCTYTTHKTVAIAVEGHYDGTYGSDFEFVENHGDLDECNGITINGQYMYLVTNEFPYVSRCLMGEVQQQEQQKGRPSLDQIFEEMDENNDEKLSQKEVKGPLANSFSKIDANDDGFITKEELEKAPRPKRQKLGRRN
nr:YHYH protein [uncultured Psychroserpens sp.]